jgi:hypothetical protein
VGNAYLDHTQVVLVVRTAYLGNGRDSQDLQDTVAVGFAKLDSESAAEERIGWRTLQIRVLVPWAIEGGGRIAELSRRCVYVAKPREAQASV